MSASFFKGSYGGDDGVLEDDNRLECPVCWYVYDPAAGDELAQVAPGTPFSALPEHWTCPQCDGRKNVFLKLG